MAGLGEHRRLVFGLGAGLGIALALGSSPAAAGPAGSTVTACVDAFERAQILEKKGRLVESTERFSSCAATDCPTALRADCAQGLDRLERAVPTVSFVVRDEAGRDVDAPMQLDGLPVPLGRGRAVPVDPGDHVVTTEPAGLRGRQVFTAHEGEKSRLIVVTVTPFAPAPSSQPPPAPTTAGLLHGAEQEPSVGKARGQSRSILPFVLGGAGLAALAIGTVIYVDYSNEESQLSREFQVFAERCASVSGCSDAERARREEIRDAYNANEESGRESRAVMGALVIGGTLAIAAALIVRVTEPAARARAQVTPLVSPLGRAGLSVSF